MERRFTVERSLVGTEPHRPKDTNYVTQLGGQHCYMVGITALLSRAASAETHKSNPKTTKRRLYQNNQVPPASLAIGKTSGAPIAVLKECFSNTRRPRYTQKGIEYNTGTSELDKKDVYCFHPSSSIDKSLQASTRKDEVPINHARK